MQDIANIFQQDFSSISKDQMSVSDYLDLCKTDKMAYATSAERMVEAIGVPKKIDTSTDPRLSRIFLNRTLKIYPAFADFYGMEDTIERIVGYYKHAAQGLEEKKQVLYLLGPVGGGKSSLAERLKELIEVYPIYVLCFNDEVSPVFESPLGLFSASKYHKTMKDEYGIDKRYLNSIPSPWAVKKLKSVNGDVTKFSVKKLTPSKLEQIAVVKTEPGDENNQDISCLVGKTDIRMLEKFSQNDPDSYSFSGALCRGNQGIVEFVEMFKAPIKVLHPLLTATQEGNYVGTEAISAIPFNGLILAHSNEAEWQTFRNNKNNEAFLDRICVIKVPYCLRVTEEENIYKKMLDSSSLGNAVCAPQTLALLSRFCVLTRLKAHDNSNIYSKLQVYDGDNIKETDPKSKSMQEYKDAAGQDEGMNGISTRFAFKVLSSTFNHDTDEIAADPVHLMLMLENAIRREQFAKDTEEAYLEYINDYLIKEYADHIGNELQQCFLENYSNFGQNLFDKYISYADCWLQDIDYKDSDTGQLFDREILNSELEKIEKPAGIANPKDFRYEVVGYVIRQGKNSKIVDWTSYEKLKKVIEKKMFSSTEELLPVISFNTKSNKDDQNKHHEFVSRMVSRGYTAKQVRRLTEWYIRVSKSN